MTEFRGLTAELYQAVVAIVDDRLHEAQVMRDGFARLEEALARLAQAQARTDARLGELVEGQARTEGRVGRVEEALARLAEAQARTEGRVGRLEEALVRLAEVQAEMGARVRDLTEAQARTEDVLRQVSRQVGGLSETLGGDIEDIAYGVLYDVLKREFGWEVGPLERAWQRWDGEPEEVDIFGRASDPAHGERTIWIVGEAKHNLTVREAERFARQVERARRHLAGEVYAVCFAYRARPEVRARCGELGIPLLFSYGRFA